MNGYALGLIEVYGLLAAIEAADACLKSANVKLVGVQDATGALMTVKVVGDVGAVKAAVSAGKARAAMVGTVIAAHVIARPAKGLDVLDEMPQIRIPSDSPAALEPSEPTESPAPERKLLETPQELTTVLIPAESFTAGAELLEAPPELMTVPVTTAGLTVRSEPTCNICQDAACPRQKGQPAKLCIHHAKVKEQKN